MMTFFAAVGAIVCVVVAAFLVGTAMLALFGRGGEATYDCTFCDWNGASNSGFGSMVQTVRWRVHFRSKHPRERDEWYADKAKGGIAYAADEQWKRHMERKRA
jgi:hypothetical protein